MTSWRFRHLRGKKELSYDRFTRPRSSPFGLRLGRAAPVGSIPAGDILPRSFLYVCDLFVPFSGFQNSEIGQVGRKHTAEDTQATRKSKFRAARALESVCTRESHHHAQPLKPTRSYNMKKPIKEAS